MDVSGNFPSSVSVSQYSPAKAPAQGAAEAGGVQAASVTAPVADEPANPATKARALDASASIKGKLSEVGGATPTVVEEEKKAAAHRPGDSKEALAARDEYGLATRSLEDSRRHARESLDLYGEGARDVGEGNNQTITKGENGNVAVSYNNSNENTRYSTEYNEKNPDWVRETYTVNGKTSVYEKNGTTVTIEEDGAKRTYTLDGGRLVATEEKGDGLTRKAVNDDGSIDVQETRKNADGAAATTSRTIPPDGDRLARATYVKEHGYVLGKDGEKSPMTDEQQAKLTDSLGAFTPEAMKALEKEGVKFAIVDPKNVPKGGYPNSNKTWPKDAQEKGEAGGYYTSAEKTVVLRSDQVHSNVIVHETAHALDDAQAPDTRGFFGGKSYNYLSEKDPKIDDLYDKYRERSSDKGKVWNDYALTNKQEYYAKAVEFYHGSADDREKLKTLDPGRYQFIEGNLKSAGK